MFPFFTFSFYVVLLWGIACCVHVYCITCTIFYSHVWEILAPGKLFLNEILRSLVNMANIDKFYMQHKKCWSSKVVERRNEWGYRLFFILLLCSDIHVRQNAPQTFYNFKIFRGRTPVPPFLGLSMDRAFKLFCVSYAPDCSFHISLSKAFWR